MAVHVLTGVEDRSSGLRPRGHVLVAGNQSGVVDIAGHIDIAVAVIAHSGHFVALGAVADTVGEPGMGGMAPREPSAGGVPELGIHRWHPVATITRQRRVNDPGRADDGHHGDEQHYGTGGTHFFVIVIAHSRLLASHAICHDFHDHFSSVQLFHRYKNSHFVKSVYYGSLILPPLAGICRQCAKKPVYTNSTMRNHQLVRKASIPEKH